MEREYYVYILTNFTKTVLYTGVTKNLIRRVYEHREKFNKGFTHDYNVSSLVYFEIYNDVYNAITREKQIKAGSRKSKEKLIEYANSEWRDLYLDLL